MSPEEAGRDACWRTSPLHARATQCAPCRPTAPQRHSQNPFRLHTAIPPIPARTALVRSPRLLMGFLHDNTNHLPQFNAGNLSWAHRVLPTMKLLLHITFLSKHCYYTHLFIRMNDCIQKSGYFLHEKYKVITSGVAYSLKEILLQC